MARPQNYDRGEVAPDDGRLVATVDPLSRRTTFTYDIRDRRTEVANPLNAVTTTIYDNGGHVQATVDAQAKEKETKGLSTIRGSAQPERSRGGNNNGPKIRVYQSATNLTPASWPWCAAFVDWCVQQWLSEPRELAWLGLKTTTAEKWRPTTAGSWQRWTR